jgi:hypothetical protein
MHEVKSVDGQIVTIERVTKHLWRLTFEDGRELDLSTTAARNMRDALYDLGWSS